jgi:hypothetical protein
MPAGVAVATDGAILVADANAFAGNSGGLIRVDPLSGVRSAVSSNGAPAGGPSFQDPWGLAPAPDGSLLVIDKAAGVIRVDPQTGTRSAVSANGAPSGSPSFDTPAGIALAADGSLVVADQAAFSGPTGGLIRVQPQTGVRSTLSANGAPAGGPSFKAPAGVAVEPPPPPAPGLAPGGLVVVDYDSFGGSGGLIDVDPVTGARLALSANGVPPGMPNYARPFGIALESGGDLLVADADAFGDGGGLIRVDRHTGVRSTLSANPTSGGPLFEDPTGLAFEPDGDALVVDSNAFGGSGGVIRVNGRTGVRTAVSSNSAPAGGPSFVFPQGIALAAGGAIVVADSDAFGGGGGLIRVDPQTGARTKLSENASPAGGPDFVDPGGVVFAPDGAILVADGDAFGGGGGVIRVDPNTGARSAVSSNPGQSGPAFFNPYWLALAADGSILVADQDSFADFGGGVIRVDAQTGTRTALSSNASPLGGPSFANPSGIAVVPTGPAPVPPPPPPPPPPVDKVAPVLSRLSVKNRRFKVGPGATAIAAARPAKVGTTFSYTLSEPANVAVVIERALPGRKVGKRCRKSSPRLLKKRPCTRFVRAGKTLTRAAKSGSNRMAFSGRIGRKRLPNGAYRATFVATDAAGNRSRGASVRFVVVRF